MAATSHWIGGETKRNIAVILLVLGIGFLLAGPGSSSAGAQQQCYGSNGASVCTSPVYPPDSCIDYAGNVTPCAQTPQAPTPRPQTQPPPHREVYYARQNIYATKRMRGTARGWLASEFPDCEHVWDAVVWTNDALTSDSRIKIPPNSSHLKLVNPQLGQDLAGAPASTDDGHAVGQTVGSVVSVSGVRVSTLGRVFVAETPGPGCQDAVPALTTNARWRVDHPVTVSYSYQKRVVIGTRLVRRVRYV